MAIGRQAIGAEKYEFVEARDVLWRLKDAVGRAANLLAQIRREEKFTLRGDLGAEQKTEIFEEEDVVRLLNDLIYGFRDLMYIVYAQIREEKAKGRQQVYAKFRGVMEKQLGVLVAEIQKMRAEEARL